MTVQEGALLCGRYRLEKLVGDGGTADVYRAFDEERQAPVAVKVLHRRLAADPDFVRRFRGEAEALAVLDHPNIVRLYALEETDGQVFIVLDYVSGVSLRDRLAAQRGPFGLAEASGIFRDVCGALHYAHRKGIVHQDVKPGNVILKPDGRAMLTDFGIARALGSAGDATMTMGTPPYMSPEQIRGDAVDAQSDIYSLGVVLYEMVAGRRPFTGGEIGLTEANTTDRLHEAHLWFNAPDPRAYNPKLPPQASAVILRALAKRPRDRWPDILSLRLAWDAALGAQLAADEGRNAARIVPAVTSRLTSHAPRKAVWAWLLGLMALVALAAVGFVTMTLLRGSAQGATAPALTPATAATVGPVTLAPTSASVPPATLGARPQAGGVVAVQPMSQAAQSETAAPVSTATALPRATASAPPREPTLIPTFTTEPSPTRPAPSSTPTRRVISATPTPRLVTTGNVTLIAPPAGAALQGRVTFEWRSAAGFTLAPGEQYELVFWQPGQNGLTDGRSPVGASSQTAATVEMSGVGSLLGLPPGPLMWGVRLWGPTGAVRMLSEGRPCSYEQPGGGQPSGARPTPDF